MEKNLKTKIEKLIADLNHYSDVYYNQGIQEVSDAEYDRLYDELLKYAEQYPEIKEWEDSPIKNVGADATSNFEKFTHKSPLLSIDQKSKEIDELKKWYEKIGSPEVIVQPKLDGITVNINYEDGKFVNAATRGNGYVGDLITEQFKATDTDYPKNVWGDLELRGEAIIPYDKFLESNMSDSYSNPRNAVAGIMHSKDANDVKGKNIFVMFYDVGFTNMEQFQNKSDIERANLIKAYGFTTLPTCLCSNWEELKKCVETKFYGGIVEKDGFNILDLTLFEQVGNVLKQRTYLQAMCDGLVIKANDLDLREELGFSQKGPKWAFAFKFKPLQTITAVRDVEWQVGKSGRVTPVAQFDEISLGGTKISRATLNNPKYMSELPVYNAETGEFNLSYTRALCYGDEILVERANDVIPRVVAIAQHNTYDLIKYPEVCPECGEKLRFDGTLLWCDNDNCPSQILGKIEHWASKNAMDIVGLSSKTIETLHSEGFLNKISDLYNLKDHRDELLQLERFGEKSVDNLLNSIEESRTRDLARFIFALSIPNVGKVMSEDLAKYYKTIENLINNFSYNQILSLDSFGEVYANSTCEWLANIDNLRLIKEILEVGVNPKEVKTVKLDSNNLDGKIFVITGTLSQPRKYFEELIIKNGGKLGSGVSKTTDYLLAGEKAGSKLDKATKLNITIIDENEFTKMIS